jgi:hypothetical protein
LLERLADLYAVVLRKKFRVAHLKQFDLGTISALRGGPERNSTAVRLAFASSGCIRPLRSGKAAYIRSEIAVLFKAIYGSLAGCAAVVFAIIALGPTRAVRDNPGPRIIALGGAIIFGALTLEYTGVASFKIVVAPIVVGGLVVFAGTMRSAKARRKSLTQADDPKLP